MSLPLSVQEAKSAATWHAVDRLKQAEYPDAPDMETAMGIRPGDRANLLAGDFAQGKAQRKSGSKFHRCPRKRNRPAEASLVR